eukprot:TRINITY_DN10081_c0_g1_i1.p1 TRINITY_DN10081_c0_g1~~TRINITY_DN10081_c0_g1_i1.p1  ORF type:complete len:473 (+),score=123.16 TRINITY_DN10081_c0_g1_i1:161-1579(+)
MGVIDRWRKAQSGDGSVGARQAAAGTSTSSTLVPVSPAALHSPSTAGPAKVGHAGVIAETAAPADAAAGGSLVQQRLAGDSAVKGKLQLGGRVINHDVTKLPDEADAPAGGALLTSWGSKPMGLSVSAAAAMVASAKPKPESPEASAPPMQRASARDRETSPETACRAGQQAEALQQLDEAPPLSPTSGGGESCDAPPLVVPGDAPLVDGLRALLLHHLRRSISTSSVDLSASQADLLEQHLGRLASYAQKIVHTLAFATRFLTKQQEEETDPLCPPASTPAATRQFPLREDQLMHRTGAAASSAAAQQQPFAGSSAASASSVATEEPRVPKKPLKLNDDELLSLFRSAQAEAASEADWRGIEGPGGSNIVGGGVSDLGYSSRSARSSASGPDSGSAISGGGHLEEDSRAEWVRLFSRAMQEPGRSPGAVAAEIADPKRTVCCGRDAVPAVLSALSSGKQQRPPPETRGGLL